MGMIKEKRKQKNLTQKELAEAIGVNVRNINRLEVGEAKIENLRFKHVVGLSHALEEPLETFANEITDMEKRCENENE
ncbi:helix-turn-helix transcriptional regulator [bacterium 210820-DFI.6.37]|nr:helix-turn-helix transcriptional regulator [bacterium 210820-DFI.6.37]